MDAPLSAPRAVTAPQDAEASLVDALAGVARREPQALGRLYDLSLGAVYALAMRVLAHPQDAEEVVSEVYLHVWDRASDWNPTRGSVLAWLRMLAWSRALDAYRRRHRERQRRGVHPTGVEDAYAGAWTEDLPDDTMAMHFDACLAAASLDALPAAQRVVLGLIFSEGLSHGEVAERTGMPLGTVKSHARRGLCALRSRLGIEGGRA